MYDMYDLFVRINSGAVLSFLLHMICVRLIPDNAPPYSMSKGVG